MLCREFGRECSAVANLALCAWYQLDNKELGGGFGMDLPQRVWHALDVGQHCCESGQQVELPPWKRQLVHMS